MRRFKKIIFAIIITCILSGAAFAALVFMGVVNLNGRHQESSYAENTSELWHIVFKGYAFSVEPVGTAIIHESGCLNIRNCDDYLIQIDVENKTLEEFWNDKDALMENIKASGYEIERSPEKIKVQEREYIRYIVSLTNERGAEFDQSYFYVLISDAGENKRFLAVVRFDGTDIASLNEAQRETVYEKALNETTAIIAMAAPTDETDDMTGSYWQVTEPMETGLEDSVANGETIVAYGLPENYSLFSDDQAGKTYYSENDRIHVRISIVPYTWLSAADMAESRNGAGISRVVKDGQYEVKGVVFYYYVYSVLHIENRKRSLSYYFNAYADLKNGEIYAISGSADDNPDAMEPESYDRFMDIREE